MWDVDVMRYPCISSYRYNSTEHPIAFHKALDLGKAPKKLPGGPAPDSEGSSHCSIKDITHVVARYGRLMIIKKDVDNISIDKPIQVAKKKKSANAGNRTIRNDGLVRLQSQTLKAALATISQVIYTSNNSNSFIVSKAVGNKPEGCRSSGGLLSTSSTRLLNRSSVVLQKHSSQSKLPQSIQCFLS